MLDLIALEFNSQLVGPTIVLGIAAAGLYGLLAVSLVLTYRVSRSIGFVQGGIAVLGTFLYWWLTYDTGATSGFALSEPRMGKLGGMLVVVGLGALIGLAYGITVTGRRLANWPRLNMTIYSLGWLLALVATAVTRMEPQEARVPSVFGTETFHIFDAVITMHHVATILVLLAVIVGLGYVMMQTQTGMNIRAIADDVEASRFVGVPLHTLGTGVYAFSGAVAAFAGALLASTVGTALPNLLGVFLRALTVCVLGGFTSFSLALAGCLLLGVAEASLGAGTFGAVSNGAQEMVVMGILFGLVLLVNRMRPIKVLEAQGL